MLDGGTTLVSMRTSSRKTTAAELRHIIGIKVPEWAEILKRSTHTVHDLESGRLKLSRGLAAKMNYESGISIKWLMDGDRNALPVTAGGKKYTKAIYDEVRARKKYFATVNAEVVRSTVLDVLGEIRGILVNANRNRNYHLAVYRTAKALAELRDEFGKAKDFANLEELQRYVLGLPSEHERESLLKIEQLIRRDYPIDGKQERPSKIASRKAAIKPKSKQPSKKRQR
jgi:hypothetical protein